MRQLRWLMLLGCVAVPLEAHAQFGNPILQDEFNRLIKEQLETNANLAAQIDATRERIAAFNREIAAARARYFSEYPNGPGIQAAAEEFSTHLWRKDFHHLLFALLAGPDSGGGILAQNELQSGSVDGGILRAARRRFDRWAEAVQERFPVRRNPLIAMNLERFVDALAASRNDYLDYAAVRDLAEFEAAGREPGWIPDTGSYIATLYFRDANLPAAAARQEYEQLVSLFGEPAVHLAGERVRRAAKRDGDLADPAALNVVPRIAGVIAQEAPVPKGLVLTSNLSPLAAFRALLAAGDPKRFLIQSIADRASNLTRAGEVYSLWVAAYGEPAVLRAARAVMESTTFRNGRVQDPLRPEADFFDAYSAIEAVLYRTDDPTGFARAAIAVEANTASEDAIAAGMAQLAAIRGEAALAAAAHDVISYFRRDTATMSKAERDLGSRLLPGREARQVLREIIEGKLSIGAAVATAVVNPEYLAWSAFEPGASVTFTSSIRTVTRGSTRIAAPPVQRSTAAAAHTSTLDKSNGSFAAIWREERGGRQALQVPAHVHRDELRRAFFASRILGDREPTSETTGSEPCQAAGRTLTCYWVRRVYSGLRGGQETLTLWLSDDIPGGVLRASHETDQGSYVQVSEHQIESLRGARRMDAPSLIQAVRGLFAPPEATPATARSGAPAQAAAPSPPSSPLQRPPAAGSSSSGTATMPALTAIPSGTRMVLRLLDAVGPRTRGGDVIRMTLEAALDIGGQSIPAGAIVSFQYGIGQDRRDRRQTRTFLSPMAVAVGVHNIPIRTVEPAPGSAPIEVGGGQSLTLAAQTMLTLIVR